MPESTFERAHLEEQIRDAGLRHQEALDQIDVVDKQIKELEVKQARANSLLKYVRIFR